MNNPRMDSGLAMEILWKLGDDAVFHLPSNVGETEVTASVIISELFVIKAKEVEHSSVEVMHVKSSTDGRITHFIGRPVSVTRFSAPSG